MFDIFPTNGLDRSILAPVLVGLSFTALLTETWGWSFVALVVPGYLAAVFVAAPWSAVAIVIEAIATYGLAHLLGDVLPRRGLWTMSFGRERFLLLVILSVIVRLVFEGWLLRLVAPSIAPEIAGSFYSVGLVLVPLTANAFWNTGFKRGLFHTGSITALTYATLVLVLLPFTNLNLSELEVTYETVALHMLETPRMYIILICGALFATAMNVRYGWDFAGILVPGLLAVGWYSPTKIATTFLEAWVAVLISKQIVKLPYFASRTIEGPRRLLLIYVVAFSMKWIAGLLAFETHQSFQATELYGFGYVLPSLLGVKIWQREKTIGILLPTLAASLFGFLSGNLIAFLLAVSAGPPAAQVEAQMGASEQRRALLDGSAWTLRDPSAEEESERLIFIRDLEGIHLTSALRIQPFSDGSRLISATDAGGVALWRRESGEGALVVETAPDSVLRALVPEIAEASGARDIWLLREPAPEGVLEGNPRARLENGRLVTDVETPLRELSEDELRERAAANLPAPERETHPSLQQLLLDASEQIETDSPYHPADETTLRAFSAEISPETVLDPWRSRRAIHFGLVPFSTADGWTGVREASPRGMIWAKRDSSGPTLTLPYPEGRSGMVEALSELANRTSASEIIFAGAARPLQPDHGRIALRAPSYSLRATELALGAGQDVWIVRDIPTHHERWNTDIIVTPNEIESGFESEIATLFPDFQVVPFDHSFDMFPFRGAGDPAFAWIRLFAPGRGRILWISSRMRSELLLQRRGTP